MIEVLASAVLALLLAALGLAVLVLIGVLCLLLWTFIESVWWR